MNIAELLDKALLDEMIQAGYVRATPHIAEPLMIYNYSQRAQFDGVWNDVTRQCRGLIATFDGTIVARPWPKFFNWGEIVRDYEAMNVPVPLDLEATVEVSDKMDGSMGILYPLQGRSNHGFPWAIATRGSFHSTQAVVASNMLVDLYSDLDPADGFTYLFEIIYPENRIVVDYGGERKLVFLGSVEIETGDIAGARSYFNGWTNKPRAELLPAVTLRDALALEPRLNAEGVVVRFADDYMVKIKQEDYVALHRLVTGLTERVVWERLGMGDTIVEITGPLPEEFWPWVEKVADGLWKRGKEIESLARARHNDIITLISLNGMRDWSRKDYAEQAKESEYAPLLFSLFDGKDIWPTIWKQIKPEAAKPMVSVSEDTA